MQTINIEMRVPDRDDREVSSSDVEVNFGNLESRASIDINLG